MENKIRTNRLRCLSNERKLRKIVKSLSPLPREGREGILNLIVSESENVELDIEFIVIQTIRK